MDDDDRPELRRARLLGAGGVVCLRLFLQRSPAEAELELLVGLCARHRHQLRQGYQLGELVAATIGRTIARLVAVEGDSVLWTGGRTE